MRLEHLLSEEEKIKVGTPALAGLRLLSLLLLAMSYYRTDVGIWEPAQAWGSTLRDSTPPVRTVSRPFPENDL